MTQTFSEALYPHLPVLLQNAACCWYGWREARVRLGRDFDNRFGWLQNSEKWTRGDIEAYQDEKLRELIRYAYGNVPFYREKMGELKLTPDDVRSVDDLPKMPILTKEDVRAHFQKLLSVEVRKSMLIHRHTSGTTGKSLDVYVSPAAIAFQWAVWWRHRSRFGLWPGMWHVNFTAKSATPQLQMRPPYWRWNRPMHQVLINIHHLTVAKIKSIIDFLNEHPFEFYSGYPSYIHAMVLVAKEAGLRLASPPRVITTSAENLLDLQRADIKDFTGSVLTDQWGQTEACGNASMCAHGRYHEDFEFGIVEQNCPVSEGGRTRAAMVCTGFACPEFPFIRYEVADVGLWYSDNDRCPCGLQSSTLEMILGRVEDYVITPEGTRIMRFDFIFKATANIREAQVVQDRIGEIRVLVVRRSNYDVGDERTVLEEIRRWISPTLRVHFEYVDEIERGSNGKFRAVKSLLRPAPRPWQPPDLVSGDTNGISSWL
ncbi:MAG: phenylacetate--CoA ligase family protein [Candidatus Korobacteraceae bacterium]